jgi:hypothetical protein
MTVLEMEKDKGLLYICHAGAPSSRRVLNQKELRMIFHKNMIISCEIMNRNKISLCGGNMQDIMKIERTRRGVKHRATNMSNVHTSTIGHMNMFLADVLLTHGKLVQVTGDVVCCAYV